MNINNLKMTKQQLDKNFVLIYDSIYEYSTKALKHFRSKIEIDHLLSETYLYVLKNINRIYDIQDVESFSKTFIKNSIRWTNSEINRTLHQKIEFTNLDVVEYCITDSDNLDFSKYNILYLRFVKSLTNYEKRLFNIWFNLEIKNGKDLSTYLNISLSLSYRTIKECKMIEKKFKSFILTNYNL